MKETAKRNQEGDQGCPSGKKSIIECKLNVITNSYNFNPLSLILIPSIDIGIGFNSVENCFLTT